AKRQKEAAEAKEAAEKAAAEAAAKESRTRARLRKSYEDSVAAVLKEIEVRRQLGETSRRRRPTAPSTRPATRATST
ncbi:MAG: hypothetical protein II837_13905, partial [Treponema sp.]|nr:hypothetical protein [Treponema sp.]